MLLERFFQLGEGLFTVPKLGKEFGHIYGRNIVLRGAGFKSDLPFDSSLNAAAFKSVV